MVEYSAMIELLAPAAREAGNAIMAIYHQGVVAAQKSDGSPVTEADKQAEEIILAALQANFPEITIISEENVSSHSLEAPDQFFLVDPLDGTKEFLKQDGRGCFTVNIALIENGTPTLGIVYAPALDRMFCGSANTGAVENGEQISVRTPDDHTMIAVASASHRDTETDQWLSNHSIQQIVSIGSSLKFCLVANGEADIYPRFSPTMEWDTAAGDAILRAAGGIVENLDATPFVYGKPQYRNGAFVAKGKM